MPEIPLDVARERLLDQIYDARCTDISAAREALHAWLRKHPDEPGMADAFEVLSHREEVASELETHPEIKKTATDR